ncbi:Hypothetical protein NCS54_00995900 [Fusarium falciforme]|uniref:Hypothetical protein n=1 Tax=Fusarium falciforme TaxID=195108 RepID=UPI0023001743|nr:Hypothetical protein NCS54_00995900 [Fusarium falciforme]WAO92450.1 Hypothetical protein NCS54_00995900 [Fusarium falciforme]
MEGIKTFSLGDFELQNGVLPNAWIAYKTFGDPSLPAVLYPSWFSGAIYDNEWLIGDDKTLNPAKYFIIIPALFGNGQSTSPSNSDISPFPQVSFYDNVRAQHQLVTKGLGIKHLHAVLGWSMGAAQSFQWATQFPDFMDVVVPFCGSARTSLHNQVFLEGVKSALLAAKGTCSAGSCKDRLEGSHLSRVWTDKEKEVGLKAFGRGYAGWGFSQAFYRHELFKKHYNAPDLETFMREFWEKWALSKDPENLLVMLQTWQSGDVSKQEPYNGDFEKAMASIKAKTLVLPSKTDLYFPPEDSEYEVSCMNPEIAELDVYPSIWGHWAGGPPGNMEDVKWLDERLRRVFGDSVEGLSEATARVQI